MKKWYKQLHWQIIIGLLLGLIWGLVASIAGFTDFTTDYISPLGTIFFILLMFIVFLLFWASLIVVVTGRNNMAKFSRMEGKTVAFYMVTPVCAITMDLPL